MFGANDSGTHVTAQPQAPRLPPIWMMGLCNLPFGIFGAVMTMALPQLLAARGVPEQQIASVTAISFIPGFSYFIVAPLLDVRFSRKCYAYALAFIAASSLFLSLMCSDDLTLLSAFLFTGFLAIQLFNSAIGGWLGSLVPSQDESRLGAWITVAGVGGFGITSMVAITLLRELPFALGAAVLSLLVVAPVLLFPWLPASATDRRQARESFRRLFRDLVELGRRPEVLRTLPLFLAPCATFALCNTLGGFGAVFHASEHMVSIAGGIGTTIAAIIGSLIVPSLARRFALRNIYLMTGTLGALFSLTLTALPHSPAVFALAIVGENIFMAAATTTAVTLMFSTIGKANPLAATQFALLNAAMFLPVTYMQAIDGYAYGWHGPSGSFLADALLSLAACGVIAVCTGAVPRKAFSLRGKEA